METNGIVHNGVIVPDQLGEFVEGTRVRIVVAETAAPPANTPKTFAEEFAEFRGICEGPEDLAAQHDHYRLGTPKR